MKPSSFIESIKFIHFCFLGVLFLGIGVGSQSYGKEICVKLSDPQSPYSGLREGSTLLCMKGINENTYSFLFGRTALMDPSSNTVERFIVESVFRAYRREGKDGKIGFTLKNRDFDSAQTIERVYFYPNRIPFSEEGALKIVSYSSAPEGKRSRKREMQSYLYRYQLVSFFPPEPMISWENADKDHADFHWPEHESSFSYFSKAFQDLSINNKATWFDFTFKGADSKLINEANSILFRLEEITSDDPKYKKAHEKISLIDSGYYQATLSWGQILLLKNEAPHLLQDLLVHPSTQVKWNYKRSNPK